jgi:hypothetical protein
MPWPGVDTDINTNFRNALPPPARRDPLAIDLDGDGIETVGIAATPILFDHNADGIRTGTGWVKADDAWLVLDRDGNGLIDSGRELFGVDTLLSGTPGVNAVYASTGFAALAALNSNGDGVFNSSDAAFTQVRLWQDLNQDGISQTTELFTLAQKNIASIGLTPTTGTVNMGNGNTVTGQATVTRTNGTATQIDSVAAGAGSMASNLNLANNPFYRKFTDSIPLTAASLALPEMAGSGVVRDLREAMSLSNTASAALVAAVQAFAAGSTRDSQMSALGELLRTWARTEAITDRFSLQPLGAETRRFVVTGSADTVLQARLARIIPVLEVFNGQTVDESGWASTVSTINNVQVRTYTIAAQQAASMQASYDSLSSSVYSTLIVQTRLRPYLEGIELVIDAAGIRFDFGPAVSALISKSGTDGYNAVLDLLDLKKHAASTLEAVGWQPYTTLSSMLNSPEFTVTPAIQAVLSAERIVSLTPVDTSFQVTSATGSIVLGNSGSNILTGIGTGADQLYGFDGNDTLTAAGNGDTLDGGAGDDVLRLSAPANSSTTFIGGAGNDTITGGHFSDFYVFNSGDGADTVTDFANGFANTDELRLGAGISTSDITPLRSGEDLIFKRANSTDQITVKSWFANGYYQLEQIKFADGTVWTSSQVNTRALEVFGTAAADSLTGVTAFADTLRGLDGNDTLTAAGNGDTLDGGAGDDVLRLSTPANSSTTFIGGTGNDTITGGHFSDFYSWGRTSESDTVTDSGGTDRLDILAGVTEEQVWLRRTGNNLELSVIGTSDRLTINGWYSNAANRVESFRLSDGQALLASQAQQLVDAMASFAPPAMGQTTLPANYQTALNPVIAANWV